MNFGEVFRAVWLEASFRDHLHWRGENGHLSFVTRQQWIDGLIEWTISRRPSWSALERTCGVPGHETN